MERVFGTLQNRLPQELRLAGITTQRRPTASSPSASWPSTTPASRSPRPSPAAPSWPTRAIWPRFCACRSSAWSATTTACATRATVCRSRHTGTGTTSSRSRYGCTPTRTAGSHLPRPALPGPLPARRAPCGCQRDDQTRRLSPLGGGPGGFAGQRSALPTTPPGQQQSGHLMSYENRTSYVMKAAAAELRPATRRCCSGHMWSGSRASDIRTRWWRSRRRRRAQWRSDDVRQRRRRM